MALDVLAVLRSALLPDQLPLENLIQMHGNLRARVLVVPPHAIPPLALMRHLTLSRFTRTTA